MAAARFLSVELSEMCFDGLYLGVQLPSPSACPPQLLEPSSHLPLPALLYPHSFPPLLKLLNPLDGFLPHHSRPVSIPKPWRACGKSKNAATLQGAPVAHPLAMRQALATTISFNPCLSPLRNVLPPA